MDLVDLQVFKCVVDEGGVIKAASKLHRAPSSVTTRIQQLESSLGVKLHIPPLASPLRASFRQHHGRDPHM